MKTTIHLPEELLEEAMLVTKCLTKSETVRLALEELIQHKHLEQVIAAAGTLSFATDWDKARHAR